MIKITRVTALEDLEEMRPHFILTGESEADFLQQIASLLLQAPERIMILQARQDDEERDLCGFIIVQNPGVSCSYMWIAQVWVDKHQHRKLSEELLARVLLWAVSVGKTAIRGQIQKAPQVFYRRFGFEVRAYIVEHTIDQDKFDKLVEAAKEIAHG